MQRIRLDGLTYVQAVQMVAIITMWNFLALARLLRTLDELNKRARDENED